LTRSSTRNLPQSSKSDIRNKSEGLKAKDPAKKDAGFWATPCSIPAEIHAGAHPMPDKPLQDVLHYLRRVTGPAGCQGTSDAQLLERFVNQRDESAFELLVWRHSKMVLGVCRRVLRDAHAAEDAFQAAFFALARRAGSITRRESVGGWLYQVAYRMALRARNRRAKRCARECLLDDNPAVDDSRNPASEAAWRELRSVIDEEVNRLPERYRVPFVLAHFDGLSNSAIARELSCPLGTVDSWLTRARERLRQRLARRGVTVSAGLLAVALSQEAARAAVPAALVVSLVRAAATAAVGPSACAASLSPQVISLTEGVLRTMFLSKVKSVTGYVLAVAFVALGGTAFVQQTLVPGPAATLRAAPVPEKAAAWQVEPALLDDLRVQQELQLSEDQLDRIDKLVTDVSAKNQDEPYRTYFQKVAADVAKALPDVLSDEQVKRLKQIQLQEKGMDAFADPVVAQALKLNEEQKKMVQALREAARKAIAGQERDSRRRRPTAEEKRLRELAVSLPTRDLIVDGLEVEQKQAWHELAGEPFYRAAANGKLGADGMNGNGQNKLQHNRFWGPYSAPKTGTVPGMRPPAGGDVPANRGKPIPPDDLFRTQGALAK
jgi:RNA polymerase sigma factor (sigma-70 family)